MSETTTTSPPLTQDCPHQHFTAEANVERDTLIIKLKVRCKQCGKPLIFPGQGDVAHLQAGWSVFYPNQM